MSVAGELVDVAETFTGAKWVRLALKVAPYAVIAGLAIALLLSRQTLQVERLQHKADAAEVKRQAADDRAAAMERLSTAIDGFATRAAAVKPIIIQAQKDTNEYAQSPAGHVLCRDADRVRSIDDLDASLWPTAPARGGAEPVPADAATPAAGR